MVQTKRLIAIAVIWLIGFIHIYSVNLSNKVTQLNDTYRPIANILNLNSTAVLVIIFRRKLYRFLESGTVYFMPLALLLSSVYSEVPR